MSRWLACLAAGWLMFAAAPALAAKSAPPNLSAIRSISVIARLGDNATAQYQGLTVFQSKQSNHPISDWTLDDLTVAQVKAALGDRFVVASAPTASSGKMPFITAITTVIDVPNNGAKAVERWVKDWPPSDVDAYLLVLPVNAFIMTPAVEFYGPGVLRNSMGHQAEFREHNGEAAVYLSCAVYLVDAKTRHVIAAHLCDTAGVFRMEPTMSAPPGGWSQQRLPPMLYTQDTTWPTAKAEVTDAQWKTVHDGVVQLIDEAIPYTLAEMGVAPGAGSAQ